MVMRSICGLLACSSSSCSTASFPSVLSVIFRASVLIGRGAQGQGTDEAGVLV
jgi:hypothetical protein